MSERITMRHLTGMCNRLNRLVGAPEHPYMDGQPQPGNFHIDSAYGGYSLYRMREGGGESDVLRSGRVSARELYHQIYAFIEGIEFQKERSAMLVD